jgi:hypothetical protein
LRKKILRNKEKILISKRALGSSVEITPICSNSSVGSEHLVANQGVAGSNPVYCTIRGYLTKFLLYYFGTAGLSFAGSNPALPTSGKFGRYPSG